MKQGFIDLLSGEDGVALEMFRLLAAASVLVALALEVFSVLAEKPFDIQAYGIGLAAVLLAAGGAIRIKEGPPPATPSSTTTTQITEKVTQ